MQINKKIEIINKYSSKKSFWLDFPDDRPYNKDDHLQFLLPVASIIRRLDIIEDKEKKAHLQKLKTLWEVNAEDLGPKDYLIYCERWLKQGLILLVVAVALVLSILDI